MPRVYNRKSPGVPKEAIYVGRPTIWGNPFKVLRHNQADHEICVLRYRQWLENQPELIVKIKAELVGKDLVCWCKPLPCHADVLLEIANK